MEGKTDYNKQRMEDYNNKMDDTEDKKREVGYFSQLRDIMRAQSSGLKFFK